MEQSHNSQRHNINNNTTVDDYFLGNTLCLQTCKNFNAFMRYTFVAYGDSYRKFGVITFLLRVYEKYKLDEVSPQMTFAKFEINISKRF